MEFFPIFHDIFPTKLWWSRWAIRGRSRWLWSRAGGRCSRAPRSGTSTASAHSWTGTRSGRAGRGRVVCRSGCSRRAKNSKNCNTNNLEIYPKIDYKIKYLILKIGMIEFKIKTVEVTKCQIKEFYSMETVP